MRDQLDILKQLIQEAMEGTKVTDQERVTGAELAMSAARHARSAPALTDTTSLIMALNDRIQLVLDQQAKILDELAKRSMVH